tara:strand:- start:9805 stop:11883 length:2079 start_codon:yes stop_codon:yes gene_type:complete
MAQKANINFNTYVEKDVATSSVDWSAITKNLTETLTKIDTERKAKKAEIDKNSIEVETQLNELEQYDSTELGTLAIGMSQESASFLQMQNNLFKRGLITQAEFAQAKQRVLGDWKQFSNVSKAWNDEYKEYVTRQQDGTASTLEQWLNKQNVAFGNLKDIKGYVNPNTGRLSLAQVDPETGKISEDPGKHVSMNTINNRFKAKFDAIKTSDFVKGSVDALGAYVSETLGVRQETITEEGWGTQKYDTDFQKNMRNRAAELTANTNNTAVIAGQLNKGKFTYNVEDLKENPDMVVMKLENGIATMDTKAPNYETNRQKVEDLLYGEMMMQLDEKYTKTKGFEKTSSDVDMLVDEEILTSKSTRQLNEQKVGIQEALKNNTITKTNADIAIDKINAKIKEKQVDANVKNINSMIDDRALSGEQRTTKILADIDLQNRTLELKERINTEAENKDIVPYQYRDGSATAMYGDFEGTGTAYLKEELGDNIRTHMRGNTANWAAGPALGGLIIGGPPGALAVGLGFAIGEAVSRDDVDQVTNALGTYISGTMDPNLKNKLLERGPIDARFGITEDGKIDASKLIFEVGKQSFTFPPEEDGEAKDAALRIMSSRGIRTSQMKQWLDKYVIDPMTLTGIANQIAEKEANESDSETLEYSEFVVKFGNMSDQQTEYNKYLEDPVNYTVPVVQGDDILQEEE